jgi:hypothetical protein
VSAVEYARDFALVQNALGDTALATDLAVSVADKQLIELQQANAWLAAIAASNQTQSLASLVGTATTSVGAVNSAISAQQGAVDAQAIGAQQAIAEARAQADAKAAADAIAAAAAAARQVELNVFRNNIPTTYLPGQTDNPYWEAQLSSWRNQHIAKFGFAWDSPWGTNAATSGSYEMLKSGYLASIPAFASGGDFGGGFRMVGERGPELEATGASRITSTNDLMAALRNPQRNSEAIVEELRAVRYELVEARKELADIRRTNQNMDWTTDKWDNEGMPEARTV